LVHKYKEQRRLVFSVDNRERADPAYACPIHRRDCCVADEGAERALLRAGKQVIASQLEVLPRRGLIECVAMGKWGDSGDSGSGEKVTSVHEYLVLDRGEFWEAANIAASQPGQA
jgi:hypothetical protein